MSPAHLESAFRNRSKCPTLKSLINRRLAAVDILLSLNDSLLIVFANAANNQVNQAVDTKIVCSVAVQSVMCFVPATVVSEKV